jgi:protein-tyrosine phosphatase
MAHPNIKIDTSVQSAKRSHPDTEETAEIVDGPEDDTPALDTADSDLVPPFLRQPVIGSSRRS